MKLSQFKFQLPEERIALRPSKFRDEAKLMVLHKKSHSIEHREFKDIIEYFNEQMKILRRLKKELYGTTDMNRKEYYQKLISEQQSEMIMQAMKILEGTTR